MSIETFKMPFVFRSCLAAPTQVGQESGAQTPPSPLSSKLGIYPLYHQAKKIPDTSAYAQLLPENRLVWLLGTLKEIQEGDLLKVCWYSQLSHSHKHTGDFPACRRADGNPSLPV